MKTRGLRRSKGKGASQRMEVIEVSAFGDRRSFEITQDPGTQDD